MSSKQSKFSLNSFRRLDLPNLLLNIWDYSDFEHLNCGICKQCKNWCILAAEEKWNNFYYDFDEVVSHIIVQNKK